MIIKANFSAGGILSKKPCVYILTMRNDKECRHYVGKTGTSNETGISSPFKRLAAHIAKRGKTQSCIWDNDLNKDFLQTAAISFRALLVEENDVSNAEKWVFWEMSSQSLFMLNKQTKILEQPKISPELQKNLKLLVASINL